jgi:hypothetical protein
MEDLPRPEVSDEERIHETRVRLLNQQFPLLDPLMCSVLLKCPADVMEKLKSCSLMWKTPPASSHVLIGNVSVSDPEPEPEPIEALPEPDHTPPVSPRSVLPNNE